MLGLASASGVVAEEISTPIKGANGKPSGHSFGASNARVAKALRNLAADIEAGGSDVLDLTVVAKITPDDFLTHTLTVNFITKADTTES